MLFNSLWCFGVSGWAAAVWLTKPPEAPLPAIVRVFLLPVSLVCAAGGVLAWRWLLRADEGGLTLRNMIRTQHLAWDEIWDFDVRRESKEVKRVLTIVCRDSSTITLWNTQWYSSETLWSCVDDLRAWLNSRDGAP